MEGDYYYFYFIFYFFFPPHHEFWLIFTCIRERNMLQTSAFVLRFGYLYAQQDSSVTRGCEEKSGLIIKDKLVQQCC